MDILRILWCCCKAFPQNTIIKSYFVWPPTPVSTLASSCVIFPQTSGWHLLMTSYLYIPYLKCESADASRLFQPVENRRIVCSSSYNVTRCSAGWWGVRRVTRFPQLHGSIVHTVLQPPLLTPGPHTIVILLYLLYASFRLDTEENWLFIQTHYVSCAIYYSYLSDAFMHKVQNNTIPSI